MGAHRFVPIHTRPSMTSLLNRGNKQGRLKSSVNISSPVRLLLILVVAVFAAELSLMMAFSWLPPIPLWMESTLDAFLLVILLFPILYFRVFKPLRFIVARQMRLGTELESANRKLLQDISEREHAEDELHVKEEFFRMISENVEDYIAVIDLEGRRLYNNPSYAKLFGNANAMKGTDSFAEIHPGDRERVRQIFRKTVKTGIGHRAEFRFVLADGSIHYMESIGRLIKNSLGEPLHVIVVSRDITDRKKAEDKIHTLAFYDSLTSLPNRRLLIDHLEQTMASSKRNGLYSALMFLDLDNFKPLNDEHGHGAGDILLIETASRMRSCVREMDTVARFGGDEFIVMIIELDADKEKSAAQAEIVAEKIRAALAEPYLIRIHHGENAETTIEHHCTSSIGVVLFINHEASAEEIIMQADKAMYQAKAAGRNQIQYCEAQA